MRWPGRRGRGEPRRRGWCGPFRVGLCCSSSVRVLEPSGHSAEGLAEEWRGRRERGSLESNGSNERVRAVQGHFFGFFPVREAWQSVQEHTLSSASTHGTASSSWISPNEIFPCATLGAERARDGRGERASISVLPARGAGAATGLNKGRGRAGAGGGGGRRGRARG